VDLACEIHGTSSLLLTQKLDHIANLRYSEYTLVRIRTSTKHFEARNDDTEYSLRLKPRGSGLAATLSIHRLSLVAGLPDLRVDELYPSYKSGVRRQLSLHSPIGVFLSEDVFSRTTRARIRTLLSIDSTTRAACQLARYSSILFVL